MTQPRARVTRTLLYTLCLALFAAGEAGAQNTQKYRAVNFSAAHAKVYIDNVLVCELAPRAGGPGTSSSECNVMTTPGRHEVRVELSGGKEIDQEFFFDPRGVTSWIYDDKAVLDG